MRGIGHSCRFWIQVQLLTRPHVHKCCGRIGGRQGSDLGVGVRLTSAAAGSCCLYEKDSGRGPSEYSCSQRGVHLRKSTATIVTNWESEQSEQCACGLTSPPLQVSDEAQGWPCVVLTHPSSVHIPHCGETAHQSPALSAQNVSPALRLLKKRNGPET